MLPIRAPLGGHLGSLQSLASQTEAELHEYSCTSLWRAYVFTLLQKYLGLEFLGPTVTAHRVSKRPACPSTPAAREDHLLRAQRHAGHQPLHFRHPSACEVVSHYGFSLHSSKG